VTLKNLTKKKKKKQIDINYCAARNKGQTKCIETNVHLKEISNICLFHFLSFILILHCIVCFRSIVEEFHLFFGFCLYVINQDPPFSLLFRSIMARILYGNHFLRSFKKRERERERFPPCLIHEGPQDFCSW
jgi:hypothetical protein